MPPPQGDCQLLHFAIKKLRLREAEPMPWGHSLCQPQSWGPGLCTGGSALRILHTPAQTTARVPWAGTGILTPSQIPSNKVGAAAEHLDRCPPPTCPPPCLQGHPCQPVSPTPRGSECSAWPKPLVDGGRKGRGYSQDSTLLTLCQPQQAEEESRAGAIGLGQPRVSIPLVSARL